MNLLIIADKSKTNYQNYQSKLDITTLINQLKKRNIRDVVTEKDISNLFNVYDSDDIDKMKLALEVGFDMCLDYMMTSIEDNTDEYDSQNSSN